MTNYRIIHAYVLLGYQAIILVHVLVLDKVLWQSMPCNVIGILDDVTLEICTWKCIVYDFDQITQWTMNELWSSPLRPLIYITSPRLSWYECSTSDVKMSYFLYNFIHYTEPVMFTGIHTRYTDTFVMNTYSRHCQITCKFYITYFTVYRIDSCVTSSPTLNFDVHVGESS